jgi:hypothetical protein
MWTSIKVQVDNNKSFCHNEVTIKIIEAFECLCKEFLSTPNFKDANVQGHHSFFAELATYRRYVQYIEHNSELEIPDTSPVNTMKAKPDNPVVVASELQRVDFNYPELCSGSDPVTCVVEGNDFSGSN